MESNSFEGLDSYTTGNRSVDSENSSNVSHTENIENIEIRELDTGIDTESTNFPASDFNFNFDRMQRIFDRDISQISPLGSTDNSISQMNIIRNLVYASMSMMYTGIPPSLSNFDSNLEESSSREEPYNAPHSLTLNSLLRLITNLRKERGCSSEFIKNLSIVTEPECPGTPRECPICTEPLEEKERDFHIKQKPCELSHSGSDQENENIGTKEIKELNSEIKEIKELNSEIKEIKELNSEIKEIHNFLPEIKKVIKLPCNHYYHLECITPWLKKNNRCPLCRFQLPSSDNRNDSQNYTDLLSDDNLNLNRNIYTETHIEGFPILFSLSPLDERHLRMAPNVESISHRNILSSDINDQDGNIPSYASSERNLDSSNDTRSLDPRTRLRVTYRRNL